MQPYFNTDKQIFLYNNRSSPIKSIVALVLAGGFTRDFSTGNDKLYKACLPVNGRPIVDYVVQALEQSNAEKIFIAQEEDANLQQLLVTSDKCIFFTKKDDLSSFGLGMISSLENLAEYYGSSELSKRIIMVVPCDTPLVTKDHFNRLIAQAAGKCADAIITIISAKRLEERFPQRNFRSVYLSDYKSNYTMQNVLFLSGDFIQYNPSAEPGKLRLSFRGWDAAVFKRVEDGITSIDDLRHQSHFYNKIFLLWLLTKGYTSYIFKLLLNLAFRRLTMAKVVELLNGADHLQTAYIESDVVEFSADIDKPEDFQMLLDIS